MTRTKTYLLTLLLFVLSGTFWTLENYGNNELRIIILVMVLLICAVIDLLQFIRMPFQLNLLLPGIITSVVFFFTVQGSNVEREFFSSIGIINGMVCLLLFVMQILRRNFRK